MNNERALEMKTGESLCFFFCVHIGGKIFRLRRARQAYLSCVRYVLLHLLHNFYLQNVLDVYRYRYRYKIHMHVCLQSFPHRRQGGGVSGIEDHVSARSSDEAREGVGQIGGGCQGGGGVGSLFFRLRLGLFFSSCSI
mmetsp:Transcript_16677/g.30611  ORF Transcript_16677/g.30611 Transcript_16677/m.30611 type:complete len:138 (-) Transcript_16677:138-551(-)